MRSGKGKLPAQKFTRSRGDNNSAKIEREVNANVPVYFGESRDLENSIRLP